MTNPLYIQCIDTLYHQHSDVALDLCAVHVHHPIEQLVFLDLREFHWMVFHHDLRRPCQQRCTAYNSLSHTSHSIDIMDQWHIHNHLMADSPHTPSPLSQCLPWDSEGFQHMWLLGRFHCICTDTSNTHQLKTPWGV